LARRNSYRLIVIKYTVKDVAAFLTKRLQELDINAKKQEAA
jgi:hypothetical protein